MKTNANLPARVKTGIIFLIFTMLVWSVYAQNSREIILKSPVSEVTVYLKGAQLSRTVTTNVPTGKSVIKFTDLSPYIDAKSIQLKIKNSNVTVFSVNHQYNHLDSLKMSKETESLKARLDEITDEISLENNNLKVIEEELEFLKENRSIGGTTTGVSLTNLKEIGNYYREQNKSLRNKQIEVNKAIRELTKKRDGLTKELDQQGKLDKEPVSEIVIQVNAKQATTCAIELSYYVDNANWFPSYDIRSNGIGAPIELAYKANIRQNTREEWKNVRLRVSSLNPKLSNILPEQKIYYINYFTAPPRYNIHFNDQVTGRVIDERNEPVIGASIQIAGTSIGTVTDINGNFNLAIPSSGGLLQISYVGYKSQIIPINNNFITVVLREDTQLLDEVVVVGFGTQAKNQLTGAIAGTQVIPSTISKVKEESTPIPTIQVERQTSIEFEIKTPYSVPSDNKTIVVDMERYSLKADYEYFSIPKADPDAFLQAYITDWEQYNLMEGEANIFYENSFVGKTILNTRSLSDTLNISLGRDKSVQVNREKLKEMSTQKFLGSKKEDIRNWKTTIRNNKSQPIKMVLLDQVPVSTTNEIEVSVDELSGAKLNKETGEVKWTFSLNPTEKKDINMKYTVKYPKNRALVVE